MCLRAPGVAVLQRGVRQEGSMGVAQRTEVPAVVSAGAVRFRRGCAAADIWGRGGLGVRETRVKLGGQPWRLVKRT